MYQRHGEASTATSPASAHAAAVARHSLNIQRLSFLSIFGVLGGGDGDGPVYTQMSVIQLYKDTSRKEGIW